MVARNFFCQTLFASSFLGKSRFYEIFSHQKSSFVLLAKENVCRSAYVVPRRKFYSFYVRPAIDLEDPGLEYEIPETKPSTLLLLYPSLSGFVCGFSLLKPSVAYVGD